MHSRAPATHVGAIHHVVMEKREVMECLDAHGRSQGLSGCVAESIGPHEQDDRAQTLAAGRKTIGNWAVERFEIAAGKFQRTDGRLYVGRIFSNGFHIQGYFRLRGACPHVIYL